MKKLKIIKRNLEFFIPMLFRLNPWIVVNTILSALLSSVGRLLWILIPKFIIEELMGSKDIKVLAMLVLALALSNFLTRSIQNFIQGLNYINASKADFAIEDMFSKKIMKVDYFNIEDPQFADQIKRAKEGMNRYSNGIYSFIYTLQDLISSVITLLGVIGIVLLSKEYLVILVSLVGVMISAFNYSKIQKLDKNFNHNWVRHSRRLWYYNDGITSFRLQKDLRLYQAKKMISDAGEKEIKEAYSEYNRIAKKKKLWDGMDTFVTHLVTRLITLILLAYAVYDKNMTIAVFTMLYQSINTFDSSMVNLVYSTRTYVQDCAYQEEFINIMEKQSIFADGTLPISEFKTLEFKNVSFKYPRTDNFIIKNLDFKIDSKEKVSLVGLNGSGKTTIIKLICRFYAIDEGEILVNGININNYKYEDYMKLMAIVFQDFKIISFSIKSNVAILDENQDKLYDCLKRAQVLEKVLSLPKKENTYINKWFDRTGVEFSGGEMQKFALARCLYKDADFVVLDEPTSNLDPMAEAEIYYNFKDIVGEKLTIFISHRLSSCIFSDRIFVLDGSSIVEEGTHKDLMNNKGGLYHKMFTTQGEYYKS
ncbi:MAG: ABC transporter ATP-binding protein [Bacilli bacterium]|jgi:ABC-type multidrug transport system fused ATPase/permease subunit|nr:ABC transporter ATP-binding protein [Bacilli bacterium]MDD2681547.1 ABC transporter ATP-binding protein [Bacilli bacterium]MDD3121184.1 ABC transporter ATP-binding protein [Bacilli bacterium]MDD4482572.1 ABC transporter ATP-binding protein [Bacilli bacterium]MDD5183019.1 ABC transporter ATP-binding protein [Bacilli bacterium]